MRRRSFGQSIDGSEPEVDDSEVKIDFSGIEIEVSEINPELSEALFDASEMRIDRSEPLSDNDLRELINQGGLMAFQHTRDPYSLDDGVYGAFCDKMKQFLAEDNSLPHRPTQFVAEQILRADAYIAALDEFQAAETNMHTSSRVVKAAVDGISAKLLWFKYILPTMIIGPDTLIEEFGLDGEMPEEYAKIKNLGDEVLTHWNARRAEPIFAPIVADGDLLAGLLTSYDNAVAAQNTAQNVYSTKSVAKNAARDSHHELEREIFNWYRAHYTDPYDEYWVKTPWGKASGGGEGGGEDPEPGEQLTPWPGPAALVIRYIGYGTVEFAPELIEDMVGGKLEARVTPDGEFYLITALWTFEEGELIPYRQPGMEPGDYEARFTPTNEDGEPGESTVMPFTVEEY